jgi:hypothetical protein
MEKEATSKNTNELIQRPPMKRVNHKTQRGFKQKTPNEKRGNPEKHKGA